MFSRECPVTKAMERERKGERTKAEAGWVLAVLPSPFPRCRSRRRDVCTFRSSTLRLCVQAEKQKQAPRADSPGYAVPDKEKKKRLMADVSSSSAFLLPIFVSFRNGQEPGLIVVRGAHDGNATAHFSSVWGEKATMPGELG